MIWATPWGLVVALLRKLAAPLLALVVGLLLGVMTYQWVKTSNTIDVLEEKVKNADNRRQEAVNMLLEERAEGERELETEKKRNVDIEKAWQLAYAKAEEVRRNEIGEIKRMLDAASVQRERLFESTRSTYRSLASTKPGSPEVVCRSDAAAQTFGELLIRSHGVSESLGRQAEGLASQVRALQAEVTALERAR